MAPSPSDFTTVEGTGAAVDLVASNSEGTSIANHNFCFHRFAPGIGKTKQLSKIAENFG